MGLPNKSLNKAQKGTVSVANYKNGLRLRWRFDGARQAIYVSSSLYAYEKVAYSLKGTIERDLLLGAYDGSLAKYQDIITRAGILEATLDNAVAPALSSIEGKRSTKRAARTWDCIDLFNKYLAAKGKSEHNLSSYYYDARQMLKRWGSFSPDDVPQLLNNEPVSNKTFNDRRNCLYQFFEWCVRKQNIVDNPLTDVSNKKRNKAIDQRRPFSGADAEAIIEALRLDRFCPKSSGYKHSQYWRFVAFLLHTGARNGEAIGLRVKDVDLAGREIRIAYSLSRTRKGSNVAARILKGTKMENVRFIPMDDYLVTLLTPICAGRNGGDFVFVNKNGNPIDDKMFQRRVFRYVLEHLSIDKRDLYACRHTFATRAVKQGIKPHEVAYIMGDAVETILANYFHNNQKPKQLPPSVYHE